MVTFRKNVMIIYANYAHVGIIYAGNKEDSVTANRENVIKIKQKHPHAAYLPVPIAKPISLCVLSAKERIQKTQLLVVPVVVTQQDVKHEKIFSLPTVQLSSTSPLLLDHERFFSFNSKWVLVT